MTEAKTFEEMSPGLSRVVERARRNPHERQLSLAYLIDVEALKQAYGRLRKDAAVGVDGVNKEQYGRNLKENLKDLHQRLKAMKYRHQPITRVSAVVIVHPSIIWIYHSLSACSYRYPKVDLSSRRISSACLRPLWADNRSPVACPPGSENFAALPRQF